VAKEHCLDATTLNAVESDAASPARGTAASASAPAATVLIVCPGGLEHGGGIGRQMGYFLQATSADPAGACYRVIDSRGPWFLGAARRRTGAAAACLARCLLALFVARLSNRACLAHINIAGRGSTLRKIWVTGFAALIGLPYLLHVHDYDYAADYDQRPAPTRRAVRAMFAHARSVLVLGERDRRLLTDRFGLRESQIIVLHNAVPDPVSTLAAPPCPPALATAGCHVLFLGHLSDRKGVPELLRALASPQLASLPWRATIAGGGPIEQFSAMAHDLGIAERVHFPGWLEQTDVAALCESAQILALPSHAEGLAMAILEGMSYGIAVVTTAVGAHAEAIENGVSGLLVSPGDVGELTQALAQLMTEHAVRERLGIEARRQFMAGFEIVGYAQRLRRIHASILGEV
jgi:glycosyltransferase involved in cell wall biosynthesis